MQVNLLSLPLLHFRRKVNGGSHDCCSLVLPNKTRERFKQFYSLVTETMLLLNFMMSVYRIDDFAARPATGRDLAEKTKTVALTARASQKPEADSHGFGGVELTSPLQSN